MWRSFLSRFKKKSGRTASEGATTEVFRKKYVSFKSVLDSNSELLKIIAGFEEKLNENRVFPMAYIRTQSARVIFHTARMIKSFEQLSGRAYPPFTETLNRIHDLINSELDRKATPATREYVLPYTGIHKEMVAAVGGKNANLGEMKGLGLPIPRGFAITTTAFREVVTANDLLDQIRMQKMALDTDDPESIDRISENIQTLFLNALVPGAVEQAILEAYDRFVDEKRTAFVSLRSSAIGEDSDLSFAGQYLTVLNVPPDKIIGAYLKVLASLFTPRAIFYRLYMGIPFGEADMSVGCLEMINAKASGVLYTANPYDPSDQHILINALWGLGTSVVDGKATPDAYQISRAPGHPILTSTIASKIIRVEILPEGDVGEKVVEQALQNHPCLSPEQAALLSEYAITIENHYQSPQDIEWALDANGRVIILQARPLRTEEPGEKEGLTEISGHALVMEKGDTACPGIGFGPAWPVRSEKDLKDFPEGGVLVAAQSSPLYVMVMQKASAILVESGSITGHMASLAREFHVPTLLNTKKAMTLVRNGDIITVDATRGKVYQGEVAELVSKKRPKSPHILYTPVYQTLKLISGHIIPLNLTNPNAPGFTAENCKTIHDIMRFIHERSYTEMFNISDFATDCGNISAKLNAPLPLDLYVIDLGQGLIDLSGTQTGKGRIPVDAVVSVPFKAILSGMLHEGLAHTEPRPVNFGGFFSVMTEQMLSPQGNGTNRFGEKSYAIISDKYMNFSSRVGYHYSILDAYCGPVSNMNYINFTFMGGAADLVRRGRRARLIQQVLQSMEFLVEVHGDRVSARFSKQPEEVIIPKLNLLGKLLIYTRQMDMLMNTEKSIESLAEAFLKENYKFKPS
ncbi:MAG: phosphoenolpyruvate synthase [Proteobacteria bacterium]|nr:phosphoenolpyruvate synthase [Pseudomonadota bacterium]